MSNNVVVDPWFDGLVDEDEDGDVSNIDYLETLYGVDKEREAGNKRAYKKLDKEIIEPEKQYVFPEDREYNLSLPVEDENWSMRYDFENDTKHVRVLTCSSKDHIFVYKTDKGHSLILSISPNNIFANVEVFDYYTLDYIGEITKDNRIILTEEDPQIKLKKIQTFIFESKDKILESEIAAIMKFGIIVNVGDITGLVPLKEFKKRRVFINNFIVKDKLKVKFDEYLNDKIVFKLPEKE